MLMLSSSKPFWTRQTPHGNILNIYYFFVCIKGNAPRRFRSLGPGTCTDEIVSTPCLVGRRIPEFLGLCCQSCTQTRCHSPRGTRLADETLRPDRRSPDLSKECWISRFLQAVSRSSPENCNIYYTYLSYVYSLQIAYSY